MRSLFLLMALFILVPANAGSQATQPEIEIRYGKFFIIWDGVDYAGPFQYAYILDVVDDEVLYSEQRDGLFYLHWGELERGPYEDLIVIGVHRGEILYRFRFDGMYYVQWGDFTAGPYAGLRKLRYSSGQAHAEVRNGRKTWTKITIDESKLQ